MLRYSDEFSLRALGNKKMLKIVFSETYELGTPKLDVTNYLHSRDIVLF